jgi:hypothetical protein
MNRAQIPPFFTFVYPKELWTFTGMQTVMNVASTRSNAFAQLFHVRVRIIDLFITFFSWENIIADIRRKCQIQYIKYYKHLAVPTSLLIMMSDITSSCTISWLCRRVKRMVGYSKCQSRPRLVPVGVEQYRVKSIRAGKSTIQLPHRLTAPWSA